MTEWSRNYRVARVFGGCLCPVTQAPVFVSRPSCEASASRGRSGRSRWAWPTGRARKTHQRGIFDEISVVAVDAPVLKGYNMKLCGNCVSYPTVVIYCASRRFAGMSRGDRGGLRLHKSKHRRIGDAGPFPSGWISTFLEPSDDSRGDSEALYRTRE
jgi:hypothetical protein